MPTLDYNDVLAAVDHKHSIHTNYSGRGMYGEKCFGLVGDLSDFGLFLLSLHQRLDQSVAEDWVAYELAGCVSTDNMGLDTIFYFPGWTLENVPAEETV